MARKAAPRKPATSRTKKPAARRATPKPVTARKAAPKRGATARKTVAKPAAAAPLPKSKRNTGTSWSAAEEKELRTLIKGNTPTRVIGLKLGRSEASIRSKVQKLSLSLMPPNRSPYNRA